MVGSWFIVLASIVLTLAVGFYFGRGQKGDKDFLLGGQTLGPFIGAMTLIATYWSGYAFLGSVGVAYKFGYSQALAGASWVPPVLIAILVFANFLKKRANEMGSLTIPHFAGQIHGSRLVHFFAAVFTILLMTVFMVTQMKAMGYLMAGVIGTSFNMAVLIMGLVMIVYTVYGGMKADAYTDALQAIGMTIGSALVVIWAFKVGGFSEMTERLLKIDPQLVNPTTGAPYGSSPLAPLLIIPYGVVGLMATPYLAVRFMACKRDIKWHHMALIAFPIMIVWELLPFVGFHVRAFLPPLQQADTAMPTFMQAYFHPYVIACISVFVLMAIMSTGDSVLHNISSAIGYDLREVLYGKPLSDSKGLLVNRVACSFVGAVSIVLTWFTPPYFLVFLGTLGGGTLHSALFGPVFASIFWRGNKIGAVASMFAGGAVCAWGLLSNKLGWMEAPILGDVVGVLVYVIVSLATFSTCPRAVVQKVSA